METSLDNFSETKNNSIYTGETKDSNQQILKTTIFQVCGNIPIYHEKASEEENKQYMELYEEHEYGKELIQYLKEFETCWKTEDRILPCTLSQIIKSWSCLVWLDETNSQENNFEKVWKKCASNNILLYKWLILLYKTKNDVQHELFLWSCYEGHSEVAKWLYSLNPNSVNIYVNNELFWQSCKKGHLDLAKWLYSLGSVDIHFDDDWPFRSSCDAGMLEVTKWLYSLGGVNIHIHNDHAFKMCCCNGHLDLAKWLYSLGGVNIHAGFEYAFVMSCSNGHLDLAKWLYSLGGINIHTENLHELIITGYLHGSEYVFRQSCEKGHLEVAKWLYSLGGVDIHACDDYAFKKSPPIVIEWLNTISTH